MYNIRALTDGNGAVVERYLYTAYGEVTIFDANAQVITESAVGNPYMFQGRRLDAETGLYYFRNRMMSPELGRFVSRDPLGYVDGYNLYEYGGGNPLKRLDPMGLDYIDVCESSKRVFWVTQRRRRFWRDVDDWRVPVGRLQDGYVVLDEQWDTQLIKLSDLEELTRRRYYGDYDDRRALTAINIALRTRQGVPSVWRAGAGGFYEGATGGAHIVSNTLTFGVSDRMGMTNAGYYVSQGGVYRSSQIAANIGALSLGAATGAWAGQANVVGRAVVMGRGAATTAAATAKTAGIAAAYKGAKYAHEVKVGAQKGAQKIEAGYQTTSVRVGRAQQTLQTGRLGSAAGGFFEGLVTPAGGPGVFSSEYPVYQFLGGLAGGYAAQELEDRY